MGHHQLRSAPDMYHVLRGKKLPKSNVVVLVDDAKRCAIQGTLMGFPISATLPSLLWRGGVRTE